MDLGFILGIAAAVLQVVGYLYYYRKTIRGEVNPNPLTWFMFGYGTVLLAVLEFDKGADWHEVALPITCSICGVLIAHNIWLRAFKTARSRNSSIKWNKFWPKSWSLKSLDTYEFLSLASDYVVTVGYIMAWAVTHFGTFEEESRGKAVLIFLVFSNLSTLPGFMPIIKETIKHPKDEHWLPWTIWTVAYSLLFWTILIKADVPHPESWDVRTWSAEYNAWLGLLLYPAMNAPLHGLIAILALPSRQRKQSHHPMVTQPGE